MTWLDWLVAAASVIAIAGGVVAVARYAKRLWKKRKLDRMVRAAEEAAERDMQARVNEDYERLIGSKPKGTDSNWDTTRNSMDLPLRLDKLAGGAVCAILPR